MIKVFVVLNANIKESKESTRACAEHWEIKWLKEGSTWDQSRWIIELIRRELVLEWLAKSQSHQLSVPAISAVTPLRIQQVKQIGQYSNLDFVLKASPGAWSWWFNVSQECCRPRSEPWAGGPLGRTIQISDEACTSITDQGEKPEGAAEAGRIKNLSEGATPNSESARTRIEHCKVSENYQV